MLTTTEAVKGLPVDVEEHHFTTTRKAFATALTHFHNKRYGMPMSTRLISMPMAKPIPRSLQVKHAT